MMRMTIVEVQIDDDLAAQNSMRRADRG